MKYETLISESNRARVSSQSLLLRRKTDPPIGPYMELRRAAAHSLTSANKPYYVLINLLTCECIASCLEHIVTVLFVSR